MKNTHVEYSSEERTPTVLPEFAELLPPLSEEQLDALETKQWALDTQKGRRNLDKWELGKIALN